VIDFSLLSFSLFPLCKFQDFTSEENNIAVLLHYDLETDDEYDEVYLYDMLLKQNLEELREDNVSLKDCAIFVPRLSNSESETRDSEVSDNHIASQNTRASQKVPGMVV
jgi:hypothetical protein